MPITNDVCFSICNDKKIIYEIVKDAKKFIKMINFQFSDPELFRILTEKTKEKVEIEIITLPADSYRKVKERGEIIEEYSNLKNSGI
ncbi:MAG: hypothetical protein ACTSRP_17615, partial [Candidatus Helarchaeota archaeon]